VEVPSANSELKRELTRPPDDLIARFRRLRSRRDVADLLEVPYSLLIHILYRAPRRYPYKTFRIRKKSGGSRTIQDPHPSLKILQQKLATVLALVYPVRPSAHGFLGDRSILTNATRHAGRRYVLNVDLKDFFPSINFGRVRGLFMAKPYGLPAEPATVLAQICIYENELPQGAPTSPIVSNMICRRLDFALQELAREHRCTYTRYADDLTFSTTRTNFPAALAHSVVEVTGNRLVVGDDLAQAIEDNWFSVNERKVRLQLQDARQEVTGLTVNIFPNVRRRYIREIRGMIHAISAYGIEAAEKMFFDKYDHRSRNPDYDLPSLKRVLQGKLEFVRMVKGDAHPVYRNLYGRAAAVLPEEFPPLKPPETPLLVSAPPSDQKWAHYYDRFRPMVFMMEVRKGGDVFTGTAFAYNRHTLVTAAHNLEGRAVVWLDGDQEVAITDYTLHPSHKDGIDIALIHLPNPMQPARGVHVRQFPVAPGEEIAGLGFAAQPGAHASLSFVRGIVESHATNFARNAEFISVSLNIAGGMSGGPAIDSGGRVVGVISEVSVREEADEKVAGRTFRYVMPIQYLKHFNNK
jgi:RNA-directed DNA polymerase